MITRRFRINLEIYKELKQKEGKKYFFLWEIAQDLEIDRALLDRILRGQPVGQRVAKRIARKYPQIVGEWKEEEEI